MSKLTRRRLILAVMETQYGTDATPTGAANAILVKNLNIVPQETNLVARDLVQPWLGNFANIPSAVYATVDFEVEIAGSGAAGTVPAFDCLLQACALVPTVTADVSAVYKPVSTNLQSASIYVNVDGTLHKLIGARGTVAFDFQVEAIPTMKYKFTGLFSPVTDAPMPSADYTHFQMPVVVNTQNTSNFAIHGFNAAVMRTVNFDLANTVIHKPLVGGETVQITDRKPAGTFEIEAVDVATKDFFGDARNAVLGAVSLTHGTVAGNIVNISAPNAQITKPTYADYNGVQMLQAGLVLIPNQTTGNDEVSITFE